MLFSFLIPVYNTKKYLPKCIESILCQKGAEYEIVLIDDGSTDGSDILCDSYADKYPSVVRVIHKDNEGLLLTRRRGFKEAQGDWFICVDSDDYISPQLISNVVRIIQDYDCDMVMYNYSYCNDNGDISQSRLSFDDMSIFEGESKHIILEKRLLTSDINTMWMRAVRRDIVDIDADYAACGIRNMCEDAVQNLALYTNTQRIAYTSTPLYFYRKNDASITARANIDNWESIIRTYEITEPYLDIWGVSKSVRKSFYNKISEQFVNYCRWSALNMPKEFIVVIDKIIKSELYRTCLQEVDSTNMSTSYNRVCVPWIIKKINSNRSRSKIIAFFRVERMLNRIKG